MTLTDILLLAIAVFTCIAMLALLGVFGGGVVG